MRFAPLLRSVATALNLLTLLFLPTTAPAQWLGDTDLYLAAGGSSAAVFNARTGEPALLIGVNIPEQIQNNIGHPPGGLRGKEPFDTPPLPIGPHRGMRGNTEGGWENAWLDTSQRASSDGMHLTLNVGGQGVLLNAIRPREIRRYPNASMWGFLGPKGDAFAALEFRGDPRIPGGMVRFVVRDTASDRVLFSRTFPYVSKGRDRGARSYMYPSAAIEINGSNTGRFLFMRGPGGQWGKLMVYDHQRREMFDLPYAALSVAVSSDDRLVGIAGSNDDVIVDTDTWQVVRMLKAETPDKRLAGALEMAGFLHDNRYFVASPSQQALWLFDVKTGRKLDSIGGGSRMFETHDNILAYSGGYGHALFTTVVDGKFAASDLCSKEHCRPMPGLAGSGPLHLKPDQSGFMVTMSPNLIWHDFKTGQSRKIVLDAKTVRKWLDQHRDAPMGVKCTFFGPACSITMPEPRATEGTGPISGAPVHWRMMNYRALEPWWQALCEVVEGGTCLFTITRNNGDLQNGLRIADAIDALGPAYRDSAAVADDIRAVRSLFHSIAEDGCIKSQRPTSCGLLASRLVYLGDINRLEALCLQILQICRSAAVMIAGDIRRPLRDKGAATKSVKNLKQFGLWTDQHEAQFQRIARRACFDAIEIWSCKYVPPVEFVSTYAEDDLSWNKPEARAAWAEYLPKLVERLEGEDHAKGWKLTKITDAQAWARIPSEEREACKPPHAGELRRC